MPQVSFRILGPLEALVDGRRVDLPSRRERALLGVLLLRFGEVVSVDALVDSVWGEQAPASARHMVHEYVSRLRGVLGDASVILTRAPGYTVQRDACDLDAGRFAELLRTARSAVAAELDEALKAFDEALGLWRGDALSDVALEGDARSAAAKLDDERRAARAERVDVALALGRHNELIPDLEREIAAEPLDEQVLGQLMLALYRNGRQADALARYRDGRQTLVEEFGIEPGAELRALEQAILRHDRRWRHLPRARRLRTTAALPRIRHRGRRGGVLGWRLLLPSSSSPGSRRLRLSPREMPRTRARPFGATRSRWSTLHTRALSARCLSACRRERSPTAPGRSGSRFPIRARSHGSRPDRGGSPPRSRSA